MPQSMLKATADLLADNDDALQPVGPIGDWTTLVRVVLLSARTKQKPADWSWLQESSLRSAEATATCQRTSLESELDSAGYLPKKAAGLLALAGWWQKRIGNADSRAEQWATHRDRWRDELRQLSGVNWELADRILLFAGGVNVMPLDWGTMRIAARHGWVDPTAEYDEWQSFFVRGLHDANVDVGLFSQRVARTGAAYCGKVAKCDECPLRSLLPAGGPLPLDGPGDE